MMFSIRLVGCATCLSDRHNDRCKEWCPRGDATTASDASVFCTGTRTSAPEPRRPDSVAGWREVTGSHRGSGRDEGPEARREDAVAPAVPQEDQVQGGVRRPATGLGLHEPGSDQVQAHRRADRGERRARGAMPSLTRRLARPKERTFSNSSADSTLTARPNRPPPHAGASQAIRQQEPRQG